MTTAADIRVLARQIRDGRGLAHKRDIDAVAARLDPFSPAAERRVSELVGGHRRHGL